MYGSFLFIRPWAELQGGTLLQCRKYNRKHNKDAIDTAAEEIDEGSGKPVGKVKAAGIIWAKVSDEEKEEWKKRAIEDFESKQSSD